MRTAQSIYQMINTFDPGKVFGYDKLNLESDQFVAASKALQRLKNKGIIKSISPGMFYIPIKSVFGELKPGGGDIVEKYLFNGGKRVGYLTGIGIYNQMGFTTQVSKIYKIAYFNRRISTKVGTATIKSARSYVSITKYNYRSLQLLDVIKDFNEIPDMNIAGGILLLKSKIKSANKKQMIECSKKYTPRVRALLGAILDYLNYDQKNLVLLKDSINQLSSFKYGIKKKMLPTMINWNIK